MRGEHLRALHDERGATIVMALVFFLICAIIGSVVLTAASVNAKAVQTHKVGQQQEFTVGSAAQMVGSELAGMKLTVEGDGSKVDVSPDSEWAVFATGFWDANGAPIMAKCRPSSGAGQPYERPIQVTLPDSGATAAIDPVYGKLVIDPDLNITVTLSLDQDLTAASPYKMTVWLQCIPTYDARGKLLSFTYESPVVQKAEAAV